MRKRLVALLLLLGLLPLSSCGKKPVVQDDAYHILATTYPMYLFTTAVVGDTEGVEVSILVNDQQSACLHDYTLTVKDMEAIDRADVIVMNGAGLEDFLADPLSQSDVPVIDCSQGLELLPSLYGDGDKDPHYWMDPQLAAQAMETIAAGLAQADPDHAGSYDAAPAVEELEEAAAQWKTDADALSCRWFVATSEGFQYFAKALGLELFQVTSQEEGSAAPASLIVQAVRLIQEENIPALFLATHDSWNTNNAIVHEVPYPLAGGDLDLMMSGTALDTMTGMRAYIKLMKINVERTVEALS